VDLWPYKYTKFSYNFIMLCTGDLALRYYVGFLQIRSHIQLCMFMAMLGNRLIKLIVMQYRPRKQ